MSGDLQAADREGIATILAEQDHASSIGDADRLSASMTPDVTFTNVVGKYATGRVDFTESIRAVLNGMYAGSRHRQLIQNIAFPRPGVAIVDTVLTLSGFREAPPGGQAPDGNMYQRPQQVLVEEVEGWRVVAFHNVIIHPGFLPETLVSGAMGRDPGRASDARAAGERS